jgi:hypothetical protein
MIVMSIDDFMFAMIVAGIGLTGAYLRAEFICSRRCRAAQQRQENRLRDLYAHPLTGARDGARLEDIASMEKSRPALAAGSRR